MNLITIIVKHTESNKKNCNPINYKLHMDIKCNWF